MKYVRVYEDDYVENEYLTTYQEHCEHVANIQDNGFDFEGCIIKQADTIEELCDYVVSMNELCDVPIVEELPHEMGNDKHFISNVKFQTLQGQHGKWWVKLAIATDKGLIYVAKMNDKGELELL